MGEGQAEIKDKALRILAARERTGPAATVRMFVRSTPLRRLALSTNIRPARYLSVHLSATESVSGEVLQVPVRDGEATIDPIVKNSGDRVAERYHVRLHFPSELEPRVRWQLYRPPGGLIRERAPSFRVEEDRPGVLAGWFDTPVFPNLSVQLDRIYLKPVPGEHQVHYGVAHEHGVWEGRSVIWFEENRQER